MGVARDAAGDCVVEVADMTWGKLNQRYEVFCAFCYRPHYGTYFASATNLAAARDELVASGWKKTKGLWRCRACAIKLDPTPGMPSAGKGEG